MPTSKAQQIWVVLLTALAVRLFYFSELIHFPLADAPVMDALYHHEWAQKVAAGLAPEEAYFRAPAYPYLLGFLYKLWGVTLWLPRLLQLCLGAFSCVAVLLIAREIFNEKIAWVSGLVAAFYGPLIFFEGELLVETLMVPLALWGLWLLLRGHLFIAGFALGLSAITRPNILLFLVAVPFLLFLQQKGQRAWRLLLPVAGAALAILPVTLRNHLVAHDTVLIASQGGVNFYIGNNPLSDGVTAVVPGTRATWWGGYQDTIRIAEDAAGRPLKASEVSDYWFQRGMEFIWDSPLAWLKLMMKKTYLFWQGFEPPNNEDLYAFAGFSSFLKFLVWKTRWFFFPFGLLSPLALCGLALSLNSFRKHALTVGYVVLYSASVVAFFVCARFRVPVLPVLIPYAVSFAFTLWEGIRQKRKSLIVPFVSFLGLLFLANADFLNFGQRDQGDTEHTLGNYYFDKKNYPKALEYFERASAKAPHRFDVINNLGNVHLEEGRFEEAQKSYLLALSKNPRHESSLHNLGALYMRTGQFEAALDMFLRGLSVNPSAVDTQKNVAISASALEQAALQRWKSAGSPVEKTPQLARPFYQLGYVYYRLNDAARSLAAYQKANEICPSWADAWNDRANVLNELGKRDEAKALYLQAIEVDPTFAPAYQNVIRVFEAEGNRMEAERFRVRAPFDGAQGERSGM